MYNFFKKKEPSITFECTTWAVRKYAPIQPASRFVPEKFKNLPSILKKGEHPIDDIHTIKVCPSIKHYIGLGFVIPAWCDIEITPNGENGKPQVTYSDPEMNESFHYPEQLGNFMDEKFKVRVPIKLDNPWHPWQPKGWSALYLPMYWHEGENFEAVPGVIDHDMASMHCPINIMLKQAKTTLIKQGTPLTQVIPFKREILTATTQDGTDNGFKRFEYLRRLKYLTFKGWRSLVVSNEQRSIVNAKDIDDI